MPGRPMPRFYVYVPYNGTDATTGNGTMIAFHAPSQTSVDIAYTAGLNAGGSSEGVPGPRDRYGKGYYGAYLRDPDDNKIHIAYRGDVL